MATTLIISILDIQQFSTSYTATDILNLTAESYSMEGRYNGMLYVTDTSQLVVSICHFLARRTCKDFYYLEQNTLKTVSI